MVLRILAGWLQCATARAECAAIEWKGWRASSEHGVPRKVHGFLHIPERIVGRYTERTAMSAEKTVAVSFRVSPRFKHLLEAAAAREHRSLTNMLETLLFAYAEQHGLEVAPVQVSKKKARVE